MALTGTAILVISAVVLTLVSAAGKCPLWVPVFLLAFLEVLRLVGM